MENISHIGSLWTMTDFKLEDGSYVRLKVGLYTVCTASNTNTFYKVHVYTKGYKCRNWKYCFESKNHLDEKVLKLVTEQQLYEAYYNHWQKLNPVRMFCNLHYNNELRDFRVVEKHQETHLTY